MLNCVVIIIRLLVTLQNANSLWKIRIFGYNTIQQSTDEIEMVIIC